MVYLEEIATKDGIIDKVVHDFEFTREMNILKVYVIPISCSSSLNCGTGSITIDFFSILPIVVRLLGYVSASFTRGSRTLN